MKQFPVKAISAVMAASMLLSVAACNKNGGSGANGGSSAAGESHSGEKISSDTPWYESKIVEPEKGCDPNREVDYVYQSLAGCDKDSMVILSSGYYKMPDNIDWDKIDYSEYSINSVSVIDRATNETVSTFDINDKLEPNSYIESSEYADGKLSCIVSIWNDATYEQKYEELVFDVKTGSLIETNKVAEDATGNIERSVKIGDYRVETEMNYDMSDTAWYGIYVTAPDGSRTKTELKENGTDYYDIPFVLGIDENTALLPVSTNSGYIFFELDLKEVKATAVDSKEYEWINMDQCYNPFTADDGSLYFTSPVGIMKIDFKKKVTEQVLNYSWSDVNRSILSYLEIADISDDKIILCGENYGFEAYASNDTSSFVIVELTKADKNPHAGKTILELYSPYGYTEDKIADAILKYNETSTDYFIEVTDRYSSVDDSDYSNVESEDDSEFVSLNADSKMSNQLAMDIMNGVGPDILMNVSYYGQLNNPNYLADLTPYLGNIDSSKYFTNIIEAGKINGKLYNLPVCFQVEGIQTCSEYAGASGVGFTTEEYEAFVKDVLNGKDVITSGQAYYFAKIFTAMRDKFIVDGKVDFSGPEFAALAEYVKDNVIEKSKSWDEMYAEEDYAYASGVGATIVKADRGYNENAPAYYTNCYGMSYYLTTMADIKGSGDVILGMPSADGRGPMCTPYISVAVSAQAYNLDACGEFVKLLMSDEVQLDFAMKDNFVLSREAFRTAGKAAVEYYSGEGFERYYGIDSNSPEAKNRANFSEKNVDDMEAIIESCSIMKAQDADISLILIEEMPAYFSGQKDLDAVISIAQERCQKVINERG